MNPPTRVDQLNQILRGSALVMLVSVFCFGFLWSVLKKDVTVDAAAFLGLAGVAVNFWFNAPRTQQPTTKTDPADTPPGNGTTTEVAK